jgi:hypothetical protein
MEILAAARREPTPPVTVIGAVEVRFAGVMAFCFELNVFQSAEER